MRLGDLDALKEEIGSWGMNDYEPADFIDAIDNAPTVETKECPYSCEKCAKKMICELGKEMERPQGEWVVLYEEPHNIKTCKCSKCGRIEDIVDFDKYPYCHCGAKMKGGAE